MSAPVLLNNVDHHDVRVLLERGRLFGDAVGQTIVFPTEFEALQREYPIVFRCDPEGVYRAVALLGLETNENLYLDGPRWAARYVPALMQRGPFSIGLPAAEGEGDPMIHIDLAHPRINRTDGEPLFLEHGGNAPYLDHVAAVLQAIYIGHQQTAPMFAAFQACNLIEPVTIEIELADGRRYAIADCFTIAADRLARLDGDALERLHRADFLRAAIWAGASLGNIGLLTDAKNRRARGR